MNVNSPIEDTNGPWYLDDLSGSGGWSRFYGAERLSAPATLKKVLFICSRNQWRSPTAEQVFSKWPGLQVMSAGLDPSAVEPVTPERRRIDVAASGGGLAGRFNWHSRKSYPEVRPAWIAVRWMLR
jgi:hypothetical protein